MNRTVDAHIEHAQPVGSRLLLEEYDLGYSSATIRHEMGELEEMGFLEQPHVSAGRIPTDHGYRFYVDHGLDAKSTGTPDVTGRILERYSGHAERSGAEVLAESAAGYMASLLRETGLVVLVEHDPRSGEPRRRRLFVQGVSYILEKPEFQDVSKARPLFKTLDEKNGLIDALQRRESSLPQVRIGHENPLEPLYGCSVVHSSYTAGTAYSGTIAVIGPRRMRYNRVLPLVEKMTQVLNQTLCEKENME